MDEVDAILFTQLKDVGWYGFFVCNKTGIQIDYLFFQ